MTIRKTCPICGKLNIVEVSEASYMKWEEGALIQEAFPEKSAAEREVIKTGICPECWDKMFEQDDDKKLRELNKEDDKKLKEFVAKLKDVKVNENDAHLVVELLNRQEYNKLSDYCLDNNYDYEVDMFRQFECDFFVTTITLKGGQL